MNPQKENLRALLEDVLPSSADYCGPEQSRVLEMARQERSRRRRTRTTLAATSAVAALVVISFLSLRPRPVTIAAAPAPEPLVIHPVDDDQLMALLHATPSAIMEWPNGDRTLLVVMQR